MRVGLHDRRTLLWLAVANFAGFLALFVGLERPGLGIGHGFYLSIILVALATGPGCGAAAGVLGAGLYAVGIWLNPHLPVVFPVLSTSIRAVTYVSVGAVVGWYADRNRALTRHLETLAQRDVLTDLPNTRAFELAISSRLERQSPFVLLAADLDGLAALNATRGHEEGNDALRKAAERLGEHLPPDSDLARVGGDEFALLVPCRADDDPSRLADVLESRLRRDQCRVTFGWALYPDEGATALSLYRVAEERLYARKLLRGERRGAFATA